MISDIKEISSAILYLNIYNNGKEIRVQLEIDFIATLGSKKYYIQYAYMIPNQAKYDQEIRLF